MEESIAACVNFYSEKIVTNPDQLIYDLTGEISNEES